MRRNLSTVFCMLLFMIFLPLAAQTSEIASVMTRVQDLIRQKDYSTAKTLLAKHLKTNQNAWQLWMSLGYVLEADQEYEQALTAFFRASELKTGIDGIAAKITRLQELAKAQPQKAAEPVTPEKTAQNLMLQAHKLDGQGKTMEAGRLFVEAVELDRSLLAKDTELIEKGLAAFKNTSTDPENLLYLGAFYFYAGQYSPAEAILQDFIDKYHDSQKITLAQKLLSECREIIAQALAANKEAAAAEENLRISNNKPAPDSVQTAKIKNSAKPDLEKPDAKKPDENKPEAETVPDFTQDQVYEPAIANEHPAIVYATKKANALLNDYEHEQDEEKKLGIIWSVGLLKLPIPEVTSSFARFLESNNVDTIFATLEALEKIDQPGAQVCLQQLYKLLGHDDFRVVYRTIKAFARLPMSAEKIVPRIFRIYQNEPMPARRQMIENTVKAYGQDSIAVLDTMLKQAGRSDKRPIAELLNVLTGEDIETLINNS